MHIIKKINDSFNNFEEFHRHIRSKIFLPIIKILAKSGVTPNMITNVRLVLCFLFIILFYRYRIFSVVLISIALFLDSFDGTLARFLKKDSDRGKFLDISVDIFSVSLIVTTFGYNSVHPLLIICYILLMGFTYVFAIAKKNENHKSDWIIQPKANCSYLWVIPIGSFYLFHLFDIDYLTVSLALADSIALLVFIYYFITFQLDTYKRHRG
jgi:phosphatidylglycerophosphate synthase